jgi:hypothetical protein
MFGSLPTIGNIEASLGSYNGVAVLAVSTHRRSFAGIAVEELNNLGVKKHDPHR